MARRGNGEGSLYQRKSDGKWVGSVSLHDGTRKVIYGKTRKEVADKLHELLHRQQRGMLLATSTQTVAHFLTDWLEHTHKQRVRPRTYERYKEALELHILPALGHYQLQKLSAQQVQAFYAREMARGLAPATIRYYHSVLHNALEMAVKWDLVARNVCDLVEPPRKQRFEMQPLTLEQSQRLLQTLRGHRWEALYTLALATGLRRGEILGLKWQDIDMTAGKLQVQRILSRILAHPAEPGHTHVYVEAEPKTQRSRRSIEIAPFALSALQHHQEKQMAAKQQAGEQWQNHDYVFCTAEGKHLNPNHVVDDLKRLLKKAGLPNIRFHDLRHSVASLLFAMEVHPKIVQELLGHSNISMTMDIYSHMLPGMQQEAVKKLDQALKHTARTHRKKEA